MDYGDYQTAVNAIGSARTTLETGKQHGKGKPLEPLRVITASIGDYQRAQTMLGAVATRPAAGSPERERYDAVSDSIASLRRDIRGYARKIVQSVSEDVDSHVSGVNDSIKHEREGRKVLGLAYAPRPSANLLERNIVNTRTYVTQQRRYTNQVRQALTAAGFFDAADRPVFDRVENNLTDADTDLTTAQTRHRENVDAADIAKTDKQWSDEQKRHLEAIRKKKMF